jgi:ATP-dependent Lon protease
MLLLPGEKGELHIFEERYKQLLDDCKQPGASFGIPYTQQGYLSEFGCIVEISRVINKYPNGAADVEIRCTDLFKLEQFFMRMGQKLYPGGEILAMREGTNTAISDRLQRLLDQYVRDIAPEKLESSLEPHLGIYDVARILELTDEEKLKLIKSKSTEAREKVLVNQIKLLSALEAQKNSVQGNVFLN